MRERTHTIFPIGTSHYWTTMGVVGGVWSPKPATAHDVAPGSTIPSGDHGHAALVMAVTHAMDMLVQLNGQRMAPMDAKEGRQKE